MKNKQLFTLKIALAIEEAREGWPEQAPLSRSLVTKYALDYGGRNITATDVRKSWTRQSRT
jgi:hypothetical protein